MRAAYRFAVTYSAMVAALAVPASAAAQVAEPIVFGESHVLRSAILGQDRTIAVYVPPACTMQARCGTLYLIDGGVAQDFLPVIGLSQLGSLSGMYPAMVVVGIETQDRQHELTTPTTDREHLEAYPTLGGAADFRQFIASEVMPFVGLRYPVNDHSAVMGESLAALFIIDTALNASETFDDYFAISPSMWWDNRALGKAADRLVAGLNGTHLLYLTTANEGGNHVRGSEELAAALANHRPRGWRWTFVPRPHEEHSTIYHGAALDALRWAYGDLAEQ